MARTDLDLGATLPELLSWQARRRGGELALLAPEYAAVSYESLHQQVHAMARILQQHGAQRQHRIAIVLPNGPLMVVAWLAASCVAISAPLNPACTAAEFDAILTDLEPSAVLLAAGTDSPMRAMANARSIPIVDVALDANGTGRLKMSRPLDQSIGWSSIGQPAAPDDIAMILPTSGTTARPKKILLSHRNLHASALNIVSTLRLGHTDRCLNVMPLFHIHGLVGGILSSLAAGGSIVCAPGFSAHLFFEWLAAFQPTWYSAVPTMHQEIAARANATLVPVQTSGLRFVRSSSAALAPAVMLRLERIFNAPVIESYGMTEAAHQICSNRLPPEQRKPGSVGPAAGPEVQVMATDGAALLPVGATGEIVIRGDNITCGYDNHSAANRQSFTNDWFRTGDLGYFDADGYLFITGRLKELINRGGEKIAPREVDEALLAHPEVVQAVAFAAPHPTLGEDVAAAVVLAEHSKLTERHLRHFLLGRLANHKIPSQLVIVADIPKGPTGKLQRMNLWQQLADRLRTAYVPPQSELEKSLAQIYCEVLGKERMGVTSNFFAEGGDSLTAMQAIARIQDRLHVEISPANFHASPTTGELALAVLQLQARQLAPDLLHVLLDKLEASTDNG